jgi:predicted dehydrogenase
LHAEHAIAAAEARLAVISEKPMATSLAEADAILAAVERNRVPYTISHNFLFAPAARQALDLIRSGALGTPIIGRSQCLFNKPPANVDPARWSYRKSGGGGCLIDSAYHEIYLVEAMVNSPVRSVEARVQSKFFGLDVEDVAFLLLDHANGAVSTVTGTWCLPTPDTQTFSEVHTTGDSLRITRRGLTLHRFRRVERRWDEIPVPDLAKLPEEAQSRAGHKGFFRAVLTALAQGAELPVTARQARHNLAIIAAAKQAQAERRAVEVE